MTTLNLGYYFTRVQREAAARVSPFFPTSPSDEEQRVIDAINDTLLDIGNKYYMAFTDTEYTFTTVHGQASYNLMVAPYNQTFWRSYRMARNGVIWLPTDMPLQYMDYTDRDWLRPDLNVSQSTNPMFYTQFGNSMYLWPLPNGGQCKVRYYSTANGTDSTGTVQKQLLSLSTDLPEIQDEWSRFLVVGATLRFLFWLGNSPKVPALRQEWEEMQMKFNERTNLPEDSKCGWSITPYGRGYRNNIPNSPFTPWD